MKIERIRLAHVRLPLVEPFKISNGVVSEKDGIIVQIHSDGLVGVGEASPMSGSFYSDDTPESTWDLLSSVLVPTVLRRGTSSVDEVNTLLDQVGGNFYARAGVETAFWDLQAQLGAVPLYEALGGVRDEVESGLAVGIYPTVKELLATIERYLKQGYKRVKIKIQPGWDIEPLKEVRRTFGPVKLMVDANCAYGRNDIEHLKRLDDFDLIMIEQPLPKDDLDGHAELQQVSKTPICLDEGAKDVSTLERAIHIGSCRIVNIKIQRVGGLKNAIAMHDVCARAGIPAWGGTMPELGIGSAQTVHLATLSNFCYPTDVESSSRWFVDDIVDPPIEVRNGTIKIPSGTGNCYHLNKTKLQKYLVREETF
ncbi:MAG TPA: o-succinylbenzoate synthase [Bacteroidota bacterium]